VPSRCSSLQPYPPYGSCQPPPAVLAHLPSHVAEAFDVLSSPGANSFDGSATNALSSPFTNPFDDSTADAISSLGDASAGAPFSPGDNTFLQYGFINSHRLIQGGGILVSRTLLCR
jgi:hypothetical protein